MLHECPVFVAYGCWKITQEDQQQPFLHKKGGFKENPAWKYDVRDKVPYTSAPALVCRLQVALLLCGLIERALSQLVPGGAGQGADIELLEDATRGLAKLGLSPQGESQVLTRQL